MTELPHKFKVLLKSPAMQRALKKRGAYYRKYKVLVVSEQLEALYLFVVLVLFLVNALSKLGVVGNIMIFLTGFITLIAIIMPLDILLLHRRWHVWQKRIFKLLHIKRLDKFRKWCIHKSDILDSQRRAEKRQKKIAKKFK